MPKIKWIGASPANYTKGRQGNRVNYIVVHYTATNASAYNNGVYFSRPGANASAHYFIDGSGTIIKSVRECDTAWAAGDWGMNLQSVNIEVVSAGQDYTEAEIQELTWLVRDCMRRYHLPASRVIRHYDVTGKLCPKPYINAKKWAALRKRITTGKTPKPKPKQPKINVSYALKVAGGSWLSTVTNCNSTNEDGYAGYPNHKHNAFKARATKGTIKYRVHKTGGKWSDWYKDGQVASVSGSIDAIQAIYYTPSGMAKQHVHFRSQTTDRAGWLDWCADNARSKYDRWCGIYGEPLDRLQMYIK